MADSRLLQLLGAEDDGEDPPLPPPPASQEREPQESGFYPSPKYREREKKLVKYLPNASDDEVQASLGNPRLPDQLWRHWAAEANARGLVTPQSQSI